MTLAEEIRRCLAALDPITVEIGDESALHAGHAGAQSGGGHFRLTVVSPHFAGKTKLARHRMVYQALAPLLERHIHALAINARAPDEL